METDVKPAGNKKTTLILSIVATVVMVGGFALYYFSKYDNAQPGKPASFH